MRLVADLSLERAAWTGVWRSDRGRMTELRSMAIKLMRVYDPPAPRDGARILVDRLWPRGVSKDAARVDLWAKDIAPSAELRRWFDHTAEKWPEFRRRYFQELDARPELLDAIRERVRSGPVTFVFASRETRHNNAVALKEYLERNR